MPEWLKPFVRADQPESPKALVLYQSASILALVFGLCGVASAVQIACTGGIAGGAIGLVLGLGGILGGLAGFHKQDDPGAAP